MWRPDDWTNDGQRPVSRLFVPMREPWSDFGGAQGLIVTDQTSRLGDRQPTVATQRRLASERPDRVLAARERLPPCRQYLQRVGEHSAGRPWIDDGVDEAPFGGLVGREESLGVLSL